MLKHLDVIKIRAIKQVNGERVQNDQYKQTKQCANNTNAHSNYSAAIIRPERQSAVLKHSIKMFLN